jgi:organic hydroperoxide reductase OsmC/OhrA
MGARRRRIFLSEISARSHLGIRWRPYDGRDGSPAYLGNPANVDPEEAFVASLSSCHMLTFLAIACKQKFVLDSYEDEAVGHMEKNAEGKMAITRVDLHPKITWGGDRIPSAEQLDKMHHAAHENCFIANSVKTEVTVTNFRDA